MMICEYNDKAVCIFCGAARVNARQVCWPRNPGLGDMVAAGLSSIGITKERVEAVVGGPCGCPERQEALNRFGHRLGIGRPLVETRDPPQ